MTTTTFKLIGTPEVENHDFGFTDQKGRAVGLRIERAEVEFYPSGSSYGYTRAPGHYFRADGHATRAGKKYGASQDYKYFATAAERDVWIAKRIEDCRKAYARKFAK